MVADPTVDAEYWQARYDSAIRALNDQQRELNELEHAARLLLRRTARLLAPSSPPLLQILATLNRPGTSIEADSRTAALCQDAAEAVWQVDLGTRAASDEMAKTVSSDEVKRLQATVDALEASREEIARVRRQWTAVLDAIQDPIFVFDGHGMLRLGNKAYAKRAGVEVTELPGRRYDELFPERSLKTVEEAIRTGAGVEGRVVLPTGDVFAAWSFPMPDGEVGQRLFVHIMEDVTQSVGLETRLAYVVSAIPDMLAVMEVPSFRLTYLSPAVTPILGYVPEELLGDPQQWQGTIHEDDRQAFVEALKAAIDGRHPLLLRTRAWTKDRRRLVWIEWRGVVEEDATGRVIAIVGSGTDITERHHAERRIRLQERALIASATGIIMTDATAPDEPIVYVNPAFEKLTGYTRSEILGRNCRFLQGDDREQSERHAIRRALEAQQPVRVVLRNYDKAGALFWNEVSISPVRDLRGRITHHIGVVSDVTRRVQEQEVLQRTNTALRVITACNDVLVRADDEKDLLLGVCSRIVSVGGYDSAFVAYPTSTHASPAAHLMAYVGAESPPESQPPKDLFVAGLHHVVQAGLEAASPVTIGSTMALPLRTQDETIGILGIRCGPASRVDASEESVIAQLADNLAYGIRGLRTRAEKAHATSALLESERVLEDTLLQTITALGLVTEKRDPYTAGHQQRVARLAVAIARVMGLSDERIKGVEVGALIHDVGKVYVPAEVLNRPGKLSEGEFGMIKQHPQIGFEIVSGICFPWPVAAMVIQHHERLDGSGYPHGLQGDAICLEARILSVADVVEAISSHRPYRPALGIDRALDELRTHRGSWFDPQVVDACATLLEGGDGDFWTVD